MPTFDDLKKLADSRRLNSYQHINVICFDITKELENKISNWCGIGRVPYVTYNTENYSLLVEIEKKLKIEGFWTKILYPYGTILRVSIHQENCNEC